MNYPEGLSSEAICIMEGHNWERGPHCSSCGKVNYYLLGRLGAIARCAKRWGISKPAAEEKIRAMATQRSREAALSQQTEDNEDWQGHYLW